MVRRRAGSLDDLHVVFSDAAAWRLCLCSFHVAMAEAALAGNFASGSLSRSFGISSDYAFGFVETARKRKSDTPHSCASGSKSGASVFRALLNRAADATMVQPGKSRGIALPPLRPFKRWIATRTSQLSILFRNPLHTKSSGDVLGLGVGRVQRLRGSMRGKIAEGEKC